MLVAGFAHGDGSAKSPYNKEQRAHLTPVLRPSIQIYHVPLLNVSKYQKLPGLLLKSFNIRDMNQYKHMKILPGVRRNSLGITKLKLNIQYL